MCRFLGSLLLLALLCFVQPSSAQMTMMGVSGNQPSGASYTGPGDVSYGATIWAFYGLRAYNASYASSNGKLINIIRASDSHTCDVLAATTGGMGNTANCSTPADNGQSASSFCNATTCSVITAYDQSGANHCSAGPCDATQSTAAARPTLTFNAVGTNTAITFSSASSQTLIAPNTEDALAQPITFTTVMDRTSTTTFAGAAGDGGIAVGYAGSAANSFIYAGTEVDKAITDNALHGFQGILNGASSALVVDTTQNTALSAGTGGRTTRMYFGSNGGSQFLTGYLMEVGIWATAAPTTGQMTSMNSNMHGSNGYNF